VTANEYPEDAKALWIQFKGREFVVMYHPGKYFAYPVDDKPIKKKELQILFSYLVQEGFINQDDKHTPYQPK
jgi:hypothetical protein